MKAALITPFLGHLPLHPSCYLGYGAAVLTKRYDLDIIDLNSEMYFKHRDAFRPILDDLAEKQVVMDGMDLHPFYSQLLRAVEEEIKQLTWAEYQSIFITMPSWFVTVPTEAILRLSNLIRRESPHSEMSFFGNSLGSWTDEKALIEHNIYIRHLNDLFRENPFNEPVNYDELPTPLYENRNEYLFDVLPFRLKHGCIWGRCRFCSLAKGWNSGYRERSAKRVIQEIEQLIDRYNPEMLVCRDNSVNGKNLLAFCTYFENLKKPWIGMARADLSSREIEALGKAGCRLIYFGLESGSDRVLDEINKGIGSGQMSDFVRALYDHNITPVPSLFVGAPGETEEDFEKTVQFISDHKNYLDVLNLYPLMMTPASDFSLMSKEVSGNGLLSLIKLSRLIEVCKDVGIKVCVGEQSAEYVLFEKVRKQISGPARLQVQ